jgi:prepilin-type processing-associated H-X9-DG protein
MKTPPFRCNAAFARLDILPLALALAVMTTLCVAMVDQQHAKRAACHNNLRQLSVAMLQYADEHDDTMPPRRFDTVWVDRLKPYYREPRLLLCPADAPFPMSYQAGSTNPAPRSYLANGWGDYAYPVGSFGNTPVPLSAVLEPAQTIYLGEKLTESFHMWADILSWDDSTELEHARHFRTGLMSSARGASNFGFVDGSVRLLRFGESVTPTNLWAIDPEWRINVIIP